MNIREIMAWINIIVLCGVIAYLMMVLNHKEEIKITENIKQDENIIIINNKFDLSKAEYTERIFKDVDITSYNNNSAQTDDSPNVTATNRGVREGIVAVSYDFINKGQIHYGDLLYIDCFNKWYLVEDSMNKRFSKRVDIFLFDKEESLKINKKCNIKVIHINK